MKAPEKNFLEGLFDNVRQATESNWKLQQELFTGWTRLFPGFTNQPLESTTNRLKSFRQQWLNAIMDGAKAQRNLFDRQYDAALAVLDTALAAPFRLEASPPAKPSLAPPPAPRTEKPEASLAPAVAQPTLTGHRYHAKNIYQKIAVVTGGASGIGAAVSQELANRGARAVVLVDRDERVREIATQINKFSERAVAIPQVGDTTDVAFRKRVFNEIGEQYGPVSICVPAAGITRDGLAVRMDKETGKPVVYPLETFRQVTEVNLIAPIYWGIEMVSRLAEDRKQRGLKRWDPAEEVQGVIVFLGSVSSQGNKGQIAYAVAKAGLEGAAATLQKEAIFHGVRCGVIHPGFTDTPMVRALGEDYLNEFVLPYTQLRRLIRPEEIADAICFMISNCAVSGELWADAGWHPPA